MLALAMTTYPPTATVVSAASLAVAFPSAPAEVMMSNLEGRKECEQESVGEELRTEGSCKDGCRVKAAEGASHAEYAEESATKW